MCDFQELTNLRNDDQATSGTKRTLFTSAETKKAQKKKGKAAAETLAEAKKTMVVKTEEREKQIVEKRAAYPLQYAAAPQPFPSQSQPYISPAQSFPLPPQPSLL